MYGTSVLVLDLDNTLICTFDGEIRIDLNKVSSDVRDRLYCLHVHGSKPHSSCKTMYGITRPRAQELINYGFENFDYLVVFTAGTKDYGEKIVQYLFSRTRAPDLTLTRDDLEGTLSSYTKPLEKIKELLGLPDISNIVIVDDSEPATSKHPLNRILVPGYNIRTTKDILNDTDDEIDKIIEHLKYMKRTQFCYQGRCLTSLYEPIVQQKCA